MRKMQWYLEKFLDYPFPPETDHAERVQKALRDWGEQAFQRLFGDRGTGRMFRCSNRRRLLWLAPPDFQRRSAGAVLAVGGIARS